ncbi:hypothetical protein KNP414_06591 [Paenibacillus mucilaginosus KNP414]|uniref:Uncharacterized protein n=1 Tax=Paenibacillus mucilaginosus (strain KNP414) TaxID=1036673 RepID=F8F787_PAEMK|nr:hypothetical protein KNP414_06591 [Paenibacillus mucilaginosus KNP414]
MRSLLGNRLIQLVGKRVHDGPSFHRSSGFVLELHWILTSPYYSTLV